MIANKKTVTVKMERWMVVKLMAACSILAEDVDKASFQIIHGLLEEALVNHDAKEDK